MSSALASQLTQRFFRYLAITSQSDPRATTLPTTAGQHAMAQALADELRQLGLDEIVIDEHATVTAVKKGNVAGAPRIGFITHIDTVDVGLSPDIHPQILRFTGEDLCLNRDKDIWLRVAEHPEILAYPNEEIIFSDGTSVLGADNKSAVTVVMTVLENLTAEHRHGDIVVAFVPDEEVGLRGAKALDLARFAVDFAWTIDCCELGEIVYENFNAAAAEIRFTGVTAHPMSSKGVLVNPLLMATDYMSHFDRQQTPDARATFGLTVSRAIRTAPCCRPAFAISTSKVFIAVSSKLARWRRKSPRSIRPVRWNFTSATPIATSAMPSAKTAAPLI